MKECKHDWSPVSVGHGLFQDECSKCQCRGYLDEKTGQIKAQPLAKVIDFAAYKKNKEIKYVKTRRKTKAS